MKIEEFCQFIADFTNFPLERVHKGTSVTHDLGLDSLSYVELLLQLEDLSKIGLEQIHSLEHIHTIESLYDMFFSRRE